MSTLNKETQIKANGIAHNMSEKIQNFGHSIEKNAQDAAKDVGLSMEKVSDEATSLMKTAREYVTQNPLKSVAYSVSFGMAAGSFLRSLRRKKD